MLNSLNFRKARAGRELKDIRAYDNGQSSDIFSLLWHLTNQIKFDQAISMNAFTIGNKCPDNFNPYHNQCKCILFKCIPSLV